VAESIVSQVLDMVELLIVVAGLAAGVLGSLAKSTGNKRLAEAAEAAAAAAAATTKARDTVKATVAGVEEAVETSAAKLTPEQRSAIKRTLKKTQVEAGVHEDIAAMLGEVREERATAAFDAAKIKADEETDADS